jgi:predicted RNA binding protein YcfA (HicA-like mRNA interferase family)
MPNDIERTELLDALGNIQKPKQWIQAAERLGFIVTDGKGSHMNVRNKLYPEIKDTRSVIATIYKGMSKQVNKKIFKKFLEQDKITEDEIWKSLGMLK